MRINGQQKEAQSCRNGRPTIQVIVDFVKRSQTSRDIEIFEEDVQITVGSGTEKFTAYIEGLDDGPDHRICVATIWRGELPEESSERILKAIQMINDFSMLSTVSAFEFDAQLSMSTSLDMCYPVDERHVAYVLQAHIALADQCIEPLRDIAFHGRSVDEVARLFIRPNARDMH